MHTTFIPSNKRAEQGARGSVLLLVLDAGRILPTPSPVAVVDGLRVGREVGGDNGLTIGEDNTLSRVHAQFRATADTLEIHDTSTNGTFVNGERITTHTLKDRDVVRVGNSIVVLRTAEERAAKDAAAGTLVGISREMQRVRTTVALMAATSSTTLVLGDTGTGKELVARALHDGSQRDGPFVALNCAAIPEALAESQLFGHVAGAFTGAKLAHTGAFRAAQGGTLFLDEVGELPATVQAKLLRALETHEVTPVGSSDTARVDVRVVCATHRDLARRTKDGSFRGDLYARIAELVVRLPTLAERREDVLMLLRTFLSPTAQPLNADLAERLVNHPWPFNVRELKKLATHLALFKQAEQLELDMVLDRLNETAALDADDDDEPTLQKTTGPSAVAKTVERTPSREEVVALLQKHKGNVVRIAKETTRSRKSIYRWLQAHGLDIEDYRASSAR